MIMLSMHFCGFKLGGGLSMVQHVWTQVGGFKHVTICFLVSIWGGGIARCIF